MGQAIAVRTDYTGGKLRHPTAGPAHFVVAVPAELNGVAITGAMDRAGDAAEGELAAALAIEENVGRLDHVSEVGRVVRHLDDAPFALHVAARSQEFG